MRLRRVASTGERQTNWCERASGRAASARQRAALATAATAATVIGVAIRSSSSRLHTSARSSVRARRIVAAILATCKRTYKMRARARDASRPHARAKRRLVVVIGLAPRETLALAIERLQFSVRLVAVILLTENSFSHLLSSICM